MDIQKINKLNGKINLNNAKLKIEKDPKIKRRLMLKIQIMRLEIQIERLN